MGPKSKKEYLKTVYPRYQKARSIAEKSSILTELCIVCGYHRKHAIRLLSASSSFRKPSCKKRGRRSFYNNPHILEALKTIWLASGMPCSKRLKSIIPLWLPNYPGILNPAVTKALTKVSPATMDRLLRTTRRSHKRSGLSTTRPGSLLRSQIPIKTGQWDETLPGYLEADTVAHCGGSMLGQFTNTVDTVDILTQWTEQRAVWGKGETATLEQVDDIEQSLPFPLLGFDSDNGGEFINHHLVKHFLGRKVPIQFTRSRPYKKDDNAHIEQKNYTHVRQWLGYDRFDAPRIVELLNDLYKNEWRLYFNFFIPSVKLIDKIRVRSKLIKKHDLPKTPYQRVLLVPDKYIPAQTKQKLKEQFETLNPFQLKKTIDEKIKKILSLATRIVACYNSPSGNIL